MDHKYTGVIHWWLIFPVQSTEIKWTSAKTNFALWYKSIARVLQSYIYIEGSIKIEQCSPVYLIISANALLWLFCQHLISLHCMFTIFSTAVPCSRIGVVSSLGGRKRSITQAHLFPTLPFLPTLAGLRICSSITYFCPVHLKNIARVQNCPDITLINSIFVFVFCLFVFLYFLPLIFLLLLFLFLSFGRLIFLSDITLIKYLKEVRS